MEKILLLVFFVYAEFIVRSPDELFEVYFDVQIATFGNPILYSTYGKLLVMNKCEIKNRLGYSDIVVVKNSSGTCVDRCAEVVETMGGRGLIVVQDDGGIIESQCGIEVKNVFVLGMERKIFNKYLKGVNDVWITYKYDLMQGNFPVIEIKFSGDPEIDLHLVHNLIRIDGKFGVSWDFFKVFFVCDVGGYNVSDCVTTASNSTYCKKSILNITGQEVLSNYIIILTVFDKINLRKNSSEFLKFLKLVLSLCDNSSNCTQQYAESLIPNLIPDPNLLDIYGQKSNSQGIYTINSIDFYWSSYLESAYCLSYYNTPESCQKCSQGCFYSDLKSGNCSIWCDNQDCGYSELVCLQQSGCYNFMLNDGNCNRDCTEDPDCLDDGQYIKVFVYTVLSCCIIIFVV